MNEAEKSAVALPTSSPGEVLLRQIHPSWYQKDEPTSQAFAPTPKDSNKLSMDSSSIFTAQKSFEHHTIDKKLLSDAVFGLSHAEFGEHSIGCVPDPIAGNDSEPANPAHIYADFSSHSSSAQKNIAKRLKRKAVDRGCLYKPELESDAAAD